MLFKQFQLNLDISQNLSETDFCLTRTVDRTKDNIKTLLKTKTN